jgi:hypothetical protein
VAGRFRRIFRGSRRAVRRLARPLRDALRPSDYGAVLKRLSHAERNLRNLLWLHYGGASSDFDQRTALRRSEFKVFSQDGEDGLLLHLFSKVGTTERRFVEFGIGDPRKCNTANLALSFGWSGLLMDAVPQIVDEAQRFYREQSRVDLPRVKIVLQHVTPENINEVLRAHGMGGEIDLLSIDIDGNDYWVWEAIEATRARVVVIEYNASLGPDDSLVTVYDPSFNRYARHPRGWYHGASLAALEKLGRAKGYSLVGCESTGLNACFVRADLAKGKLQALSAAEAYYPEARRLRIATAEEQYESLRHLDFVRV